VGDVPATAVDAPASAAILPPAPLIRHRARGRTLTHLTRDSRLQFRPSDGERLPLSVDHGAHFITRVLSAYPAHVRADTDSLRRGRSTDAAMADTDGHARRPSSSLERFRQKRASSSSSSSIIPSKKNAENEPTVANGGFIAATPTTLAPRAQPRATPGSSATRPSTGDKLAALKARRSAARPASGRRGPAEESKAKSSSEDVPSKALFASGRWDEREDAKEDSADDNSKRAEDTGPSAKTRGTSAVRVSNEWREFDPRGSFGRPGSTSTHQKEVPSSSTSAPRVDDAAAPRTHHQPRPPARDATEHIEPPEAAQTPSQPVASRRRQSHSPGHQSMKNRPPVLVPAVVALHIQNEPDLKLNDVCLTVHDASKDAGIEATLARPKTTLKKTYAAHVQCGKFVFVSVAQWATSMTSCFWLFLVIFGYFWLFLVIFGYFWLFGNLCMGNSTDVVFC
jgi:hypothetical protein